jgi:hypothetical protein
MKNLNQKVDGLVGRITRLAIPLSSLNIANVELATIKPPSGSRSPTCGDPNLLTEKTSS